MFKKLGTKKSFATLALVGALVCTNMIPAVAGTNRQFYDMTIRASRKMSQLTYRSKENNNQYSWVKVTTMNGTNAVNVKFHINDTLDATSWSKINSGDTSWKKLSYSNCGQPSKGVSMGLCACNYNWSTGTGSIDGVVDYE